jgi:hypothetical protein
MLAFPFLMPVDDATVALTAQEAEDRHRAEETEAARHAEEAHQAKEARLHATAMDEYESAHKALWAQATAVIIVRVLIPIVLY